MTEMSVQENEATEEITLQENEATKEITLQENRSEFRTENAMERHFVCSQHTIE